ncbi:hypothetical protein Rt10032_c01g0403 [Rhodotorula toruloides]|uniref:Transmembrane protein n=1 Tax=Rhodotorula toruloides TaxID=5286 RepID=A0A511K8T8_RHOTO|nr:hypothetical protein Rt10032_c01g0403 [Rhodotorula toruloides]
MLSRPPSAPAACATSPPCLCPRPTSSRTTRSLFALVVAVLALIRTTNALPLEPPFGGASLSGRADTISRQDTRPFVGAPFGDFYISNDKLECEPLRISFGGGQGPPYALNMVKPPVATNGSVENVEILERIAVAGMPGMTWWSLDGTSLKVGDAVALQIVDAVGQVGYSVNRHVAEARLNEYCHYPGAFWPPSHWDGNHFVGILLVLLGIAFFAVGGVERLKTRWKARHLRRSVAPAANEGGVPLQEREGATHVLGDDEERTSLEDEDRPLLRDGEPPGEAPPAYDEVAKEEEDADRTGSRLDGREGAHRVEQSLS